MNMKAILMSIQSKWLAKILNGWKTVELRKRFPSDFRGWVYLYCTKAKPYITQQSNYQFTIRESKDFTNLINGKVVCRFWVDNVDTIVRSGMGYYVKGQDIAYTNRLAKQSGLMFDDLQERFGDNSKAIHISKLENFDKPKELNDFSVDHSAKWRMPIKAPITKAPQSWQYIYIREDK